MKKIKSIFQAALLTCFVFGIASAGDFKPVRTDPKALKATLDAARKHNDTMIYAPAKPFPIYDAGTDEWIDYTKYGNFENIGTPQYKYTVTDFDGLKKASGEGIYPNTQSVYKSPDYAKFVAEKKLDGDKWKFVDTDERQLNFYKWSLAKEDPGIKLYYTAYELDKGGNYKHALKAYYACLVFFPKTVGMTQWKTPWYIGPSCIDRIKYLTRIHPELGVKLVDADITIEKRYDNDKNNDIFNVNPGRLIPASKKDFERKYIDLDKVGIKNVVGTGNVKLIEYNNNNYRITVNDKPFVVRAICYSPTKVGLTPDNGSVNINRDWSDADINKNGIIDGPYEAWVDVDRSDTLKSPKNSVGDFALMKEMGINTIRIYHYPDLNKDLLKDGYENYGFMYMIGNLLGMYAVDSGAEWYTGTDYTDKEQQERMFASVRRMVDEYKDEPYVLMWVLGNENNYGTVGTKGIFAGTSNQAQKQPEAYYSFINECVKLIKSIDPQQRPVAICNGDTYLMDVCAKYAPDLDIYGANAYRGEQGFGPLWKDVMHVYGKPVIVTEFGCPAFAKDWTEARREQGQANYHYGAWNDLEDNLAGVSGGVGNALGGVIFEWVDEWWKAGPPPEFDPAYHDMVAQWIGPFLDGGAYEEWFGLCSQGNGQDSPFKRQLRKAYFMYRDLWKKYRK